MSTYDPREYPQGQYPQGQYQQVQYPQSQYAMPASMTGGRRTLRRIGVGSAFKVGAVLSAVLWAVFGLIFVVFALCGTLGSFSRFANNDNAGGGVLAAGGVTFIFIYLIGIVFYALIGGITSALYAWLYNITARMTGGLEVEVS